MTTKEVKIKKTLGIGSICASLVFYFFPDFSLMDFLPDFIGYILTVAGLSMLADISDEIRVARKKFSQMILVGIAKFLSVYVVFMLAGNNERPTMLLVMTFVFAIAEVLILLPAYGSLFDALLYLGTRHEGTAVFNHKKKRFATSYTDNVKRFTRVFIVVKNALCVLPEMLSLSVDVNAQSYAYSGLDAINGFRAIGIVSSLTVGIIWLCKTEKYFRAVMSDRVFIERLKSKYLAEILPNKALFVRKRIHKAFILLGLASIFAVDFYIDGNNGYNLIPDAIAALLFALGVMALPQNDEKESRVLPVTLSFSYLTITTVSWWINSYFAYKYSAAAVSRDPVANMWWKAMMAISLVEALLFITMLLFVCFTLIKVVKNNTGYVSKHPMINAEAKMNELHKELSVRLYVAFGAAVLTAASDVFRVWMFSRSGFVADAAWIIEMLVTALFSGTFCYALYRINEEAEEKYQLS